MSQFQWNTLMCLGQTVEAEIGALAAGRYTRVVTAEPSQGIPT